MTGPIQCCPAQSTPPLTPGRVVGTQVFTVGAVGSLGPRVTPGDEGSVPSEASAYPAAASRSAFWRSISCRLVMIETMITTTVTMAIRMVQAALISGVTPSRTCE